MKTILIVLAITIQLSGQILIIDSVEVAKNVFEITHRWEYVDDFEIKLLNLLEQYEQECNDTIVAKQFEDEYIIDRGSYGEMVTVDQLNKEDYYYAYRWINGFTNGVFNISYYFVKEPTFKGFIEFLRRKK